MNLAHGAKAILQDRLNGLQPLEAVNVLVDALPRFSGPTVCYREGCDWRWVKGLRVIIICARLGLAITAIREILPHADTVEVFDEESLAGYWVDFKSNPKPACELTEIELRRELRKLIHPQASDIRLTAWPHWIAREVSVGEKSSAL